MQLLQLAGLGFIILEAWAQVFDVGVCSPGHVFGNGGVEEVELVLVLDGGEVGCSGAKRADHGAWGGQRANSRPAPFNRHERAIRIYHQIIFQLVLIF